MFGICAHGPWWDWWGGKILPDVPARLGATHATCGAETWDRPGFQASDISHFYGGISRFISFFDAYQNLTPVKAPHGGTLDYHVDTWLVRCELLIRKSALRVNLRRFVGVIKASELLSPGEQQGSHYESHWPAPALTWLRQSLLSTPARKWGWVRAVSEVPETTLQLNFAVRPATPPVYTCSGASPPVTKANPGKERLKQTS